MKKRRIEPKTPPDIAFDEFVKQVRKMIRAGKTRLERFEGYNDVITEYIPEEDKLIHTETGNLQVTLYFRPVDRYKK
ncbi:MAG TPA: hypothetical protein PK545_05575 [Deltaproteobacteria bacterium]|nr:hypothetical protein [Deltaproteobacteria bacterium]